MPEVSGVTESNSNSMPTVKRSIAIAAAAGAFVAGAVLASVIALLIGNGSDSKSAGSTTSTVPVQFSIAPPAPRITKEVPVSGGMGQPVVNGGIKLTITGVSTPTAVPRSGGDTPPRAGAKLVRVDTTVENVGKKSIDLTCGYPIRNNTYDAQKRQFDDVENLYEIPGNPVCNDNLQPGFSAPMSYIYEVPQDAEIQSFGFADSDVDAGADLSFITINPSP
jgi:hypothetical protein